MNKLIFVSILFISIFPTSCSNHQIKSSDLSFAGITIGETFPDSLKNSGLFRFDGDDMPYYEGKTIFALPSNPNRDISIVAATNENDEVVSIQIGNMNFSESSDFFNMLKSKYGIPMSEYGDADRSLNSFLDNIYKQLGYTQYGNIDISGKRVIAIWKSPLKRADILMIADTFHEPDDFNPKLWTYVWFKYVDVEECNRVERMAENNRINKSRNDYRKKNQDLMNQDF